MHGVVVSVLGVTGLLAIVSLLPPLASRLNLPYTVLLAVVGCALGALAAAVAGMGHFGVVGDFFPALPGFGLPSEGLLFIFLPPPLFETGLFLDVLRRMVAVWPVLSLS